MLALAVAASAVAGFLAMGADCASGEEQGRPPPGQWWQYRGDRRLTGHAELKGAIRSPHILWRHFVGNRETLLEVTPRDQANQTIPLAEKDLHPDRLGAVSQLWSIGTGYYDLDGDGRLHALDAKVGKFLADRPSLQMLECESQFRVNTGGGDVPNYVRLKARSGGKWVDVWTLPLPGVFGPPTLADTSGDGLLEIAVLCSDGYLYVIGQNP